MMQAGRLNRRITLQSPTADMNSWGEPLPSGWQEVTKLWANVRELNGVEAIKSGAETSTVKASIRIRWRDGVTPGMRVLDGASVYDIAAVLKGAKREYMDLLCHRVQ